MNSDDCFVKVNTLALAAAAKSQDNTVGFKLSSGEFIIAKLVETGPSELAGRIGMQELFTPVQVVVGQNGLTFIPWIFSAQTSVDLSVLSRFVMAVVEVDAKLSDYYMEGTGQRAIQIPNKGSAADRLILN